MKTIQQQLLKACHQFVDDKLITTQSRIKSLQYDLLSETKSSAGDKHETGRAMLHLEIEKASQQLVSINQMKETLEKMNVSKNSSIASLGNIVETSVGNYFLSISLGQRKVDDKTYFLVSTNSPIGKKLIGKKEGDKLFFNGREIHINSIS